MTRIYVGWLKDGARYEVFRAPATPTPESHGERYLWVVGPFATLRGACFMRDRSMGNPHICSARDADRIAREIGYEVRK